MATCSNLTTITIDPRALVYLSAPAQRRLSGAGGYRFAFRAGERRSFRKRKALPVSEWAEAHRVVTMSRYPGRWRNELTPYSAGIMDASFYPSVETVIICKTPQTGISEAVNNCIAYAADRAPAPALYVFPDELTARENSRDRIQPMFTSSNSLKRLITGIDDDLAVLRINLNSMPIYLAWAGSAARLANKPIGLLVLDEIDKYPEYANQREAGPIELAEKRTTTFRGSRKIWKISTPTYEAGPIWQSFSQEAQVIFDYEVICPECGGAQIMAFKNIKWPAYECDPEKIKAAELALYQCAACPARWNDHQRDRAVRAGTWRQRQSVVRGQSSVVSKSDEQPRLKLQPYLEKYQPKKIAFHLPAWLSHFVSLSEIAAAFLLAQGSKAKLRDFKNGYEALPWVIYNAARQEDNILALRDDRPRGVVPGGGRIIALTAGVDTQDSGFYYEIRAWAGGQELESWQVDEGFVDTSAALLQVLFESDYRDAAGNQYIVNLVVHDAMGHRTAEVYDLTRAHRRRHLPYQGARSLTAPYTTTQLEFYPASRGQKRPIPGGLKLVRGNSGYYKDMLATKLEVDAHAPGAWHLHSETTEDYARQLCAEYIDDKGIWQCKPGVANHYWDCAYLNLLAADILRLKTRSQPVTNAPPEAAKKPLTANPKPKKRRFW